MTPKQHARNVARAWHQSRRAEGRCPRCGVKCDLKDDGVTRYWRCKDCRNEQAARSKAAYISQYCVPCDCGRRKMRGKDHCYVCNMKTNYHKQSDLPKMAKRRRVNVPRHVSTSLWVQPRTIEAAYFWRQAVAR